MRPAVVSCLSQFAFLHEGTYYCTRCIRRYYHTRLYFGSWEGPTNIRFTSRVANNRICIYLAGKTCIDKLTVGNSNMLIKDPLISVS